MNMSTCAIKVFKSFPLSDQNTNFVFICVDNSTELYTWWKNTIHIYTLDTDDCFSFSQTLITDHEVVSIFSFRNSIVFVDLKGCISSVVPQKDSALKMKKNSCGESSNGEPSSPILGIGKFKQDLAEKTYKIVQIDSLKNCEEIYCASSIVDTQQIIVLFKLRSKLFFLAYSFSEKKVLFIMKVPCSLKEVNPKMSVFKVFHSNHLDVELKRALFLPVLLMELVIIVLTLSNGTVLWTTSENSSNGLQLLYKCHQPVVAINTFSAGASSKLNVLCLVLKGGAVLMLRLSNNEVHVDTLFLPSAANAVYCRPNGVIVSSDFIDCSYNKFKLVEDKMLTETCLLSVKGVIKLSKFLDDENIILATTNLNLAYKIDTRTIKALEIDKNFHLPKRVVLNDLMNMSDLLDSVSEEIEEENKKLEAISLTARKNFMEQFFNVSVKIHSGLGAVKYGALSSSTNTHAFIIKIENKFKFYEFSPIMWKIFLTLSLNSCSRKCIHKIVPLKQFFKYNSTILLHFPAQLPNSCFNVNLKTSLVSKLSDEDPWLIIPIKNLSIDVTYFFTPLKSPALSSTLENVLDVEKCLEKLSSVSTHCTEMKKSELENSDPIQTSYTFKIPEQLQSSNIFNLVLLFSKYRCTEPIWNLVTEGSKSVCFVSLFNKLIQFNLGENCKSLRISCSDPQLCHVVKFAIMKLLASLQKNDILINKSILQDVHASLQALEISQVTDQPNQKTFLDFHQNVRSSIDVYLPP